MFKKCMSIVSVLFLYSIFAVSSLQAQSSQIARGLSYLTSSQSPDGTWQSDTTLVETTAATVSALETLKLLNQTAGTSYSSGVSWLQGQSPQTVDYISQRVRVLSLADGSINAIIPIREPAKGAWGGYEGYELNNFDTALALQALKAANYADLSIVNPALAYLTNTQNADGGWGFSKGEESNIFITTIVSSTLQQFPQTMHIATAINKATAFLILQQNPDGGFGSPSTIYETALAYSALVALSTDDAVLAKAVSYIASSQALDGSWNQDPYSTALALRALYLSEHKPEPPPPASTTGTIMGTVIDATTIQPLGGVTVTLASDPAISTVTDGTGAFTLNNIPQGAQQMKLAYPGYAALTLTAQIDAGTFINIGKVPLSTNPTSGTVMGTVWDADENAPFERVQILVTGTGYYQAISAADGTYKITGVEPGVVTVDTPLAPKPGYYKMTVMTGTLAPGGVMIFNPVLSKTPPPAMDLTIQTNKALYKKGDTVNLTITIHNKRAIEYGVTLKVRVTDPSKRGIYETNVNVNLQANGTSLQTFSFALPDTAEGGFYTVQADASDSTGTKKGSASTSFGLQISRISVTPTLPQTISNGTNPVSFSLTNLGNFPVSSGALNVTLKDPDGVEISNSTQAFSIGTGENKTLYYDLAIPAPRFGTYTLTYTVSDETTSGSPRELTFADTMVIESAFDKSTYRARETANLMINLKNTGIFNLGTYPGNGLAVTVSVPSAGYEETKTLASPPSPGAALGDPLIYGFTLPEIIKAGQHDATIKVVLPSGSEAVQSAQLTIPESFLTMSLTKKTYNAGETINPEFANSGGEDTEVQYKLSIHDSRSVLVAEKTGGETVRAGLAVPLQLVIPNGATTGEYNISITYQDMKSGKSDIIQIPVTINGVKSTLQVRTDKESYLTTENVTGLSMITNEGTRLPDGKLHLQIVTAAGSIKQKTWTNQYDFQQGIRNDVDTHGMNDWIIPDDDFNSEIDFYKWNSWGTVQAQNGKLLVDSNSVSSGMATKWAFDGDFDVQVDFSDNNSCNAEGAQITANAGASLFYLKNTGANGREAGAQVNGHWRDWRAISGYQRSGKLRIARTGSTIAGYDWNGTGWVHLLSVSGAEFSANAGISLEVWRGKNCAANSKFDNLKINRGKIASQNETVDSVRLLPLNDNFDDGIINADRWSVRSTGNVTTTETNGSLVTADSQAGIQSDSSVAGNFPLEGDYDISIDWKMPISPASGDWNSFFQISEVDQNNLPDNKLVGKALQIKRAYVDGLGHIYLAGHYNGDSWDTWSEPVPTNDTSGRFRIRRTGTSVTAWYWNNSLNRWEWNGDTAGYNWSSVWTSHSYVQSGLSNSMPYSPAAETDWNNFKTRNGPSYLHKGTILLRQDAGNITTWQNITWNAAEPLGTSIKFRTRTASAESELADATWSDYLGASGSPVASPPGRWIEVEATLETSDTNITPLLHDVTVTYGRNPGDIVWQTDVPVNLEIEAVTNLSNIAGVLGTAGKYYLQGNLLSSTGQPIVFAEYPFYVEQGEIQMTIAFDRKIYRPGDVVSVAGEVKNLSKVDATGIVLQVIDTAKGGGVLYSEMCDISTGGIHTFTFTTTAGSDGTYTLGGSVTQNGTRLAEIADQYQVSSPVIAATLTGPDTVGNSPFVLTLALKNSGKTDASVVVSNSISGVPETIAIPAGQTVLRQYQQQISADTLYTFTLSGDLNQTLTKTVVYTATSPDSGVSGKIVVDRISYGPNEQVSITSSLTNQSEGQAFENLTAWITVINGQGQVLFSDSANVASLVPGQTFKNNRTWNTGINPAGTYLVSLQVLDTMGTVIATAGCQLTINSNVKPSLLLKGKISLDRQSVLTGEPVTVSYGLTNVGNADLSDIQIKVRTVRIDEHAVYNTIPDQTSLAMGATFGNSGVIDTQSYTAKDYMVILSATIAGVEESLVGAYFRVEGAPSAPALYSPANGADVETLTPALTVSNASDPNDDRLSYEFEIYADSSLTSLVASGTTPETAGITAWTAATLTENQTYYWRARAYDGRLYGPWMEPASFRVNTVNDLPTAPTISSPADGTAVDVLTPALIVNNSTDPDSANLTYNFEIALDQEFAQTVASTTGVASGPGTTSWTVPVTLQENQWYYWRAQADDWLDVGPWSETARFQVNTANDAPSAPIVILPANGSTVASLSTDIVVSNSIDPDSTNLSYYFEVDTTPTFDSAGIIRSGGGVAEGEGTTLWHLDGLLENTRYFVRVKANDGAADSPWSEVTNFFASAVNDPPTAPTLANPSNGAGVNVFSPTLSVHNATDPDHDVLTYEFEVYADAAMTTLIARADAVAETAPMTSWTLPVTLSENQICYWRARASDGSLLSTWMPTASFMVNTANDAPGAPTLSSPAEGSSVTTLTPTLAVVNAIDPDSDRLTYQFEIYSGATLVAASVNVTEDISGITSWTPDVSLADDTVYQWRSRAHDGDRYGPWMAMAGFTVHIPVTTISATINFDPDTLNKTSKGSWVTVYIELPAGYNPAEIDIASILLEGAIPAELRPWCVGDRDKDGIPDLMVKFKRSEVINLLPDGESVPVHVTGKVGDTLFEGVDVIRVIH